MMVDDMCVFSILPCDHIKYPPSLHWAPKMTKFNTKPGSSRRCSISGQREDDDSIMTTWLLDFTILSRKSHAVPKCANPWGLGNVHQFLCCFPCTNVAYRTYRTSTDFTDPMDPTHIGRWKNPPGAAEHLLFHHLVLQKIFDGYPIITTWDRSQTGALGSPEFWHPIYLSFHQNIIKISWT